MKIKLKDKEIEEAINKEILRQNEHIELIASENFVSEDILKANGSVLTNKYGEGYPRRRYYGGCENIDVVETLAIKRLCKLFGSKYANVQPHSGSSANSAAINALIKPGEKILSMSLPSGGHLSHGYKINNSGFFYDSYFYEVNGDGEIDYSEVLKQAKKIKPQLIICGASAYSKEIDFKKFSEIAKEVGAFLLADIAHIAGAIIAKLHNSPVGYADVITSTTHKTLRGSRGGIILTNDETLSKKINSSVFPGFQGGALFNMIAGKAVAFYEALQPSFIEYQKQIKSNSFVFCEEFKKLGAKIVSNGTDNHLFIIDVLHSYNLSGKEAEEILWKVNITTNKNTIPNETKPPMIASGLRLGTPAMTTRGFKEEEFKLLAFWIDELLRNPNNTEIIQKIKNNVKNITNKFKAY